MKLFGRRIIFRIFFPESRRIKWGYVGIPKYPQ